MAKPIDKEYLVASLKSFDEEVLSKKYNQGQGGNGESADLSNYYTKTEVDTAIANAQLGGSDVDLSSYSTTTEMEEYVESKVKNLASTEYVDNAVGDSHTHNNKSVLDKLSETDEGILLFNGSKIQGGGEDTVIPHIGDNGNWYVNENDTGVPATGQDGMSAYEVAVAFNGFVGTEQEWLESLKMEASELETVVAQEISKQIGTEIEDSVIETINDNTASNSDIDDLWT